MCCVGERYCDVARYRKVDTRIWNDAKFNALSDRAKLVFFYELTHPNLTMLGAMRATVPGLAAELGMPPEAFAEAFREVLTKGMAKHDERASFFWLPNFLRYNKPESPNVVKSWLEAFDLLPECVMKSELFQQLKAYTEGMTKGFREAFAEAFAKAMPNQEQEQEQEQEHISPAPPETKLVIPISKQKPSRKDRIPESVLLEIYRAYPRRIGRPEALRAIEKALHTIAPAKDAEWLLGRTRAFARQRQGEEEQFTPYPATWFNGGRYDDDGLDSPAPNGKAPAGSYPAGFFDDEVKHARN